MAAFQSMLSAQSDSGRVTIGRNPLPTIRALSNARNLRCPSCGQTVVLRAGHIVRPHFAHLSGIECAHPDSEPETPEHRAGKTLLAEWAGARLKAARVTLEAPIAQTGQRADVLIEVEKSRIALEFQCADLPGRDWLRRHRLYRGAGIRDLWILGVSRLNHPPGGIREMETCMARYGAPILFLDPAGIRFQPGMIARFRSPRHADPSSIRPLDALAFPWNLLDWPLKSSRSAAPRAAIRSEPSVESPSLSADPTLREWLRTRCGVDPDRLSPLFRIPTAAQETVACAPHLWRAAVYYRFVEGRSRQKWIVGDIAIWIQRFIPLAVRNERQLRLALCGCQDIFAAAGLLELEPAPRVICDLASLPGPPDPSAVARLAAYRRASRWERAS